MNIIFLSRLKTDAVIGIHDIEKLMATEFNVFWVKGSETNGFKHPSCVIKHPLY
jgi:hypothetical protein